MGVETSVDVLRTITILSWTWLMYKFDLHYSNGLYRITLLASGTLLILTLTAGALADHGVIDMPVQHRMLGVLVALNGIMLSGRHMTKTYRKRLKLRRELERRAIERGEWDGKERRKFWLASVGLEDGDVPPT